MHGYLIGESLVQPVEWDQVAPENKKQNRSDCEKAREITVKQVTITNKKDQIVKRRER